MAHTSCTATAPHLEKDLVLQSSTRPPLSTESSQAELPETWILVPLLHLSLSAILLLIASPLPTIIYGLDLDLS